MLTVAWVIVPTADTRFLPELAVPTSGDSILEKQMHNYCKAKKFQDRMSHRGSGKAMGEKGVMRGCHGYSAGEAAMGLKKSQMQLTAAKSSVSQSSDGNGGKS